MFSGIFIHFFKFHNSFCKNYQEKKEVIFHIENYIQEAGSVAQWLGNKLQCIQCGLLRIHTEPVVGTSPVDENNSV